MDIFTSIKYVLGFFDVIVLSNELRPDF